MKTAVWTATALGLVIALLLSAVVIAEEGSDESAMEGVDEEMLEEYQEILEEETSELDPSISEENDVTGPSFPAMVRRSYNYLTASFIRNHSMWGRLPAVKDLLVAPSPGRWMYANLSRINATGEARIIDRDGDGVAEFVLWVHTDHGRKEITTSDYETDLPDDISLTARTNTVTQTSVVYWKIMWILKYVDRDGDGTPEMIGLSYHRIIAVDLNANGSPEYISAFTWHGREMDRDDSGTWDVQAFHTRSGVRLDRNGDGNPEYRAVHAASYGRSNGRTGRTWDQIHATAWRAYSKDADSDGNPEIARSMKLVGKWMDRNGDTAPEYIGIHRQVSGAVDRDSDGNPEIRGHKYLRFQYIDKNSDGNPELVTIVIGWKAFIDRDSDGKIDLIIFYEKVFKWIDRNSDGDPERVIRTETKKEIKPDDTSSLRERIKDRIKHRKRDNKDNDEVNDRDDDPGKNSDDRDPAQNYDDKKDTSDDRDMEREQKI